MYVRCPEIRTGCIGLIHSDTVYVSILSFISCRFLSFSIYEQ